MFFGLSITEKGRTRSQQSNVVVLLKHVEGLCGVSLAEGAEHAGHKNKESHKFNFGVHFIHAP